MKLSAILAATAASVAFAGAAGASSVTQIDIPGVVEDGENYDVAGSYDLSDHGLTVSANVGGTDIGNDGDFSGSYSVDLFASDPLLKAGVSFNFFAFNDGGDPVSGSATWKGTTYELQSVAGRGFLRTGFLDDIDTTPDTLTVSWMGAPEGTQVDTTLSAVPLPAAAWMLLAALGGLAGVARRKKHA